MPRREHQTGKQHRKSPKVYKSLIQVGWSFEIWDLKSQRDRRLRYLEMFLNQTRFEFKPELLKFGIGPQFCLYTLVNSQISF